MPVLRLPEDLRETISAQARLGYPHEACGLLLGRRAGAEHVVVEARQARNLNRERSGDRYELDPEDFLAADRDARAAGLDVVGVWHSHPDHPARPSETDRAAAWPEWSYVIVAVGRAGVEDLRCWRMNGGDFEEETVLS